MAEARHEYDEMAKREVQKAFVYSFEESARTLLNNYLDNVEAFCNKTKVHDPITEEEVEPDEKLMRSIEEQIGVSENSKRQFREEILIRISSLARRGQTFDYTSHDRLREAIEKKLFVDLRDVVKITTSSKTPDADQLRRINEVIDRSRHRARLLSRLRQRTAEVRRFAAQSLAWEPKKQEVHPTMFTVSLENQDWSLHRKGAIDQARHKRKVKEAIRENLADIVSEQSIITNDGRKIVKVPIRTLDEYRFRFDPNDQQQVGQGDGKSQVGDVLERYGQKDGPGNGPQAGDQPGVDYYEAEMTMDELSGMIFEDLSLPNLEEKR